MNDHPGLYVMAPTISRISSTSIPRASLALPNRRSTPLYTSTAVEVHSSAVQSASLWRMTMILDVDCLVVDSRLEYVVAAFIRLGIFVFVTRPAVAAVWVPCFHPSLRTQKLFFLLSPRKGTQCIPLSPATKSSMDAIATPFALASLALPVLVSPRWTRRVVFDVTPPPTVPLLATM